MSRLKAFLVFVLLSYCLGLAHGFPDIQENQGSISTADDEDCEFCEDPKCDDSDRHERTGRKCDCADTTDQCVDNWCVGFAHVPGGPDDPEDLFVFYYLCDDVGDVSAAFVGAVKFSCFKCKDARNGK